MRTMEFDSKTRSPDQDGERKPEPHEGSPVVLRLCSAPLAPEPSGPKDWRDEDLDGLQRAIDEIQKKLESLSALVVSLQAARDARRRLRSLK